MATQKSTQAAPAASVNESAEIVLSARRLFAIALGILTEIEEEQEKVFSLAMAGESVADPDACHERNLFRVIQTLTESTVLTNMLRDQLEKFGASVGVSLEVKS